MEEVHFLNKKLLNLLDKTVIFLQVVTASQNVLTIKPVKFILRYKQTKQNFWKLPSRFIKKFKSKVFK